MADPLWKQWKELFFLRAGVTWLNQSVLLEEERLEAGLAPSVWTPPVDIYETVNGLVLSVELPGVGKDEVSLEVSGEMLVIKGERKLKRDLRTENCHQMERNYGTFHRLFTLPKGVEVDKMEAYFRDGTLDITLPKTGESEGRRIAIEEQ